MMLRRRLLFLSPIVPAQGGNGLAMRTGFFLDAYAREFDVDLAVFPIVSSASGPTPFLHARTNRLCVFSQPPVDTHFSLVAALADPDARLSAFQFYGRPSLTSRVSAAAQEMLTPWANQSYDAVHVGRLYLAPLAERWLSQPAGRRPRLIIDCDDDDAKTYRGLAAIARRSHRLRAAAWAEAEAVAFAALAQRVLPGFDLAFAASHADAERLSSDAASVTVVPNVVPQTFRPKRPPAPRPRRSGSRTILFAASMGYAPNDDAARWFLTRIWPRLRRAVRFPLHLVLAGSNPSEGLLRLGRQRSVRVTGTVSDMAPFYQRADLAVIPLRAGGGTRIKLLEAAACGTAVVSTTIGAEGTTFRHGRDLLLADTEELFVRACVGLLYHPELAAQLARRAYLRVVRDYDAVQWSRQLSDWAMPASEKQAG
jgi:glycosyltransferase involved in cell wall biosynthesis